MKKLIYIFGVSAIFLGACSNSLTSTRSAYYDDTYFSLADANTIQPIYHEEVKTQDQSPANSSPYSSEEQSSGNSNFDYNRYQKENGQSQSSSSNPNYSQPGYADDNGKTYITNNYYGNSYDDYYYANRLSRFHNPYMGFSYFSPAYSGFYDPFYGPGWNVSIGWGMSWGSGFYDPFYNPWYGYSPYMYSPWYSPYSFYGWGYRNGFNDGYYYGNNGYYNDNRFGSGNTVINRPRPNRGGTTAPGGARDLPGSVPSNPSQSDAPNTGGIRSVPVRSTPSNGNAIPSTRDNIPSQAVTPRETPAVTPIKEVPSRTPSGYTAPAIPGSLNDMRNNNSTGQPTRNSADPGSNDNSATPIRNNPQQPVRNPEPVKINPNPNYTPSQAPTRNPNPVVQPTQRQQDVRPQQPAPSRSSAPSYSAPSRGSSSGSGGSSAPASRPRPR